MEANKTVNEMSVLELLLAANNKTFESAYKKGYKDGYNARKAEESKNTQMTVDTDSDAYKKGMEDAWKLVLKIYSRVEDGGIPITDLKQIFGPTAPLTKIFTENTVFEVEEKIKEYEKLTDINNDIKIGDEVIIKSSGEKMIVSNIYDVPYLDNGITKMYYCINFLDSITVYSDEIKKTGRHYSQIDDLKYMLGYDGNKSETEE